MPFVWVQDVSVGASVDSADIVEIRNNTDTADDAKCAAHDNGVLAGEDVGENVGANNGEDAGDNVVINVGDDSGENVAADAGANVGADAGADATNYVDDDALADSVDDGAHNPDNRAAELGNDMASYDSDHA